MAEKGSLRKREATIGAVTAELTSLMKQYEGTSMTPLQAIQEEKRKSKRIVNKKAAKANKADLPLSVTPKKAINKPQKQSVADTNKDNDAARVVSSKVPLPPRVPISSIPVAHTSIAMPVSAQVNQFQDIQQQLKSLQLMMQELRQVAETRATSSVSQKQSTPLKRANELDDKATSLKQQESKPAMLAIGDRKKRREYARRVEIESEDSEDEEDENISEEEISEDDHTEEEATTEEEDQSYGATMRGGPRRKDVKLRSYNGETPLDPYLAQFKVTARLAGWPRCEWGSRLVTALESKARRILTTAPLSNNPTYKQVVRRLQKGFASEASADVWLTAMDDIVRESGERITDLQLRIQEASAKAFPSMDLKERRRVCKGYFIRAFTDPEKQFQIMAQQPKDLEQAVKVALALENAGRSVRLRQQRNRSTPFSSQVRLLEDSQFEDISDSVLTSRGFAPQVLTTQTTPQVPVARERQPDGGGQSANERHANTARSRSRGRGRGTNSNGQVLQAVNALVARFDAMETNQQVPYVPRSTVNQRWQTQPQVQQQASTGMRPRRLRPGDLDSSGNPARCHKCGGFDHFARQCRRQDFDLGREATGQSSRPTEMLQ